MEDHALTPQALPAIPQIRKGVLISLAVMAGLVPAISLGQAPCLIHRGHRDKPGDDNATT